MLEGHHRRGEFTGLAGQLNCVRQHHDFGGERRVRERVIVVHALP